MEAKKELIRRTVREQQLFHPERVRRGGLPPTHDAGAASEDAAAQELAMVRLLISVLIHLAANAVGLLIAASILDDMSVTSGAFIIAVVIFTGVEAIAGPLIRQIAIRNANALLGSTALVTTLVGLVITAVVSDGLEIHGVTTWVLATLIVWLAALIAALVLPIIFLKKAVDETQERRGSSRHFRAG